MEERSTFFLELRPLAHVDGIKAIRAVLKALLRTYGLQCVQITERQTGDHPMPINLNDVKPDRDLVPPGIYQLRGKLKPGGAGEAGALVLSKSGCLEMIRLECAIINNKHAGQKVWEYISINFLADQVSPSASPEEIEGYKEAVRIGRLKLRALIDSAREIDPKDNSDEAQKRRDLADYFDLDGLTFWAWIDTKPGKGGYADKSVIWFIITPGSVEWIHRPISNSTAVAPRSEQSSGKTPSAGASKPVAQGGATSLRREMDDEIPSEGAEG
jgi:hypothetical protein